MIKMVSVLLVASAVLSLSQLHAVSIKNAVPGSEVVLESVYNAKRQVVDREIVLGFGKQYHYKGKGEASFSIRTNYKSYFIGPFTEPSQIILVNRNGRLNYDLPCGSLIIGRKNDL